MTPHFHVQEWLILEWERDYAPLDVRRELAQMHQWLEANPRRRKKNYQRFVVGWLRREYAKVAHAQVAARLYARAGVYQADRPAADYSKEVEEVLERYPDLREG